MAGAWRAGRERCGIGLEGPGGSGAVALRPGRSLKNMPRPGSPPAGVSEPQVIPRAHTCRDSPLAAGWRKEYDGKAGLGTLVEKATVRKGACGVHGDGGKGANLRPGGCWTGGVGRSG